MHLYRTASQANGRSTTQILLGHLMELPLKKLLLDDAAVNSFLQ